MILQLSLLLACVDKNDGGPLDGGDAPLEIAPGVWALDGLDEDLPTNDLAPFFDAVGDATFVGLGESIHTSGGFQQAKFRLFTALVEEKGFRAVGYESPWFDVQVAQAYVESCKGASPEAMSDGFLWVWEDVALQHMMEWMCGWNQAHPDDPVTLWGWDNQQPWHDGPLLDAYFARAAPADAAALSAGISTCLSVDRGDANGFYYSSDYDEYYVTGVDEADHAACMAGLAAIEDYFDSNEAALVAASSQDALDWARVSHAGLQGWQLQSYYRTVDCGTGYEVRDQANAYILEEVHRLSLAGVKSVIWAHNAHLAFDTANWTGRYGDPTGEANVGGCGAWEGMGTLLQRSLGDDYRPFAISGYDVHIGWYGWDEPLVIPYGEGASERILHDLGAGDAFVDFSVEGSLFEDQPYELGAFWFNPRDQFRGMIFVDSSWAMEWPLEDPFNAGCAVDEVRIDGNVTAYDATNTPGYGAGATICALDGACTTAGPQGGYSLCVPEERNAALSFELEGHCSQVSLLSPDQLGLVEDQALFSDTFNAEVYGLADFAYPPAPGTGNASGLVFDANYEYLEGARISVSPASGAGVAYFSSDNRLLDPQGGSGADGFFLLGELAAGWVDVTVEHPDAKNCRLTTGNYTSDGVHLHVPIVDGAETFLSIQCTP